jgi:nucleotide-binding universal stress UspA family protein
MKKIQKILFPIDLSSNFKTLIPWVKSLAVQFNATLYLLFVAQDVPPFITFYVPPIDIENFREKVKVAATKKMADTVKGLFKDFPKLETRVEFGVPAIMILEFANREKIDLIVMGSHGRKGIKLALLGSVANRVVQAAPCPVVTIHP